MATPTWDWEGGLGNRAFILARHPANGILSPELRGQKIVEGIKSSLPWVVREDRSEEEAVE